ncbi:transposase family protein [bacterium]|nr:transposase family protein [bacterium]
MPLKGFKLSKAKLILDKILLINILPRKNGRPICSVCGKRGPIYDTQPVRSWRHLAGFGIRVIVEYSPRRVKCRNCHRVITEQMPWSIGKCHLTKPFIYQLALWAREFTLIDRGANAKTVRRKDRDFVAVLRFNSFNNQ